TVSDKLFVSNVVYASIGNGGGVAPFTSISAGKDGRPNLQGVYNANVKSPNGQASNFLHANMNNHRWYGFISGLDYRATDRTTISAGIDGRTYKGEHYREVYDLLGASYAVNTAFSRNMNINPDIQQLKEGDKISFNNDGFVRYVGGFLMTEYKTNVVSAFISGTLSTTNYKRKDYFLPKIFDINGQQVPVGFYTNPTALRNERRPVDNVLYTQSDYMLSGSDTVRLNQNTPVTIGSGSNARQYQQVSGEGKLKESDWVNFTGYTLKGGLNYNLNEYNNIFFNLGYISKAPFFNNVFNTTSGDQYQDVRNEGVASFEIGYGINRGNFKANLNAYHTTWYNRSQSRTTPNEDTEEFGITDVQYILTGLDARHVGVELELAQEISRKITLNAAISLGDWRWNGTGFVRRLTVAGQFLSEGGFNADKVHVGGSAQNQFMVGVRYEPIPGLYIRPTYLMFAKNYADFSPQDMNPNETPQDAFRLPTSRNIDIHSGYTWNFYKDLKLTLNGSLLNVLNEHYITDAPTRANINQFDPNSIEVFFNRGRT
ncbi:MAG TPA: hypothetical protein VK927_00005, partial [Adhaeribacter sp.]|nr:hypothetical protein [Adhaeribacter sp.]